MELKGALGGGELQAIHSSNMNPFNGIERVALSGSTCRPCVRSLNPFNGIESSERVERVEGRVEKVNPFNGIESKILIIRNRGDADALMNPFNGIERILFLTTLPQSTLSP